MKSLIIIPISFILFLCSCENYKYHLDKNKLYIFQVGDTLIYKSRISSDTFIVAVNDRGMRLESDELYYETQIVYIHELTGDCKDSTLNYCSVMIIRNDVEESVSVSFRNMTFHLDKDTFDIVNYNIGNKTLKGVYEVKFSSLGKENDKEIKTFYYTYKYGIIAYELLTGELFELEERYFTE